MSYIVSFFLLGLVLALVAVASNPSPYFGALGLVVAAGLGCCILAGHGGSFLSLILFLIYLGGMLVVFAYSAALAAEPYPETWGSWPVMVWGVIYLVGTFLGSCFFWGGWYSPFWVVADEFGEFSVLRADTGGVGLLYSVGGGMLVIAVFVLLLALFVVLELTRGLGRGVLRAV
uniref:NADH-ubiquinone oxidoreductase chain 6 n=1 Tax=Nuchequula nuchalis TaxID=218810 RepID=A0A0B6VQY0_NUCNU|nr:NADH dehydrogenase subunit 6 [Leiognathus brevirostris]UNI91575.1 NADH dehydrogenase subunit 6 [Leiognathus brevirostris]BAQ20836.1 NADH dehydrogenase subunit 6 [Nuchequula nuchalis]